MTTRAVKRGSTFQGSSQETYPLSHSSSTPPGFPLCKTVSCAFPQALWALPTSALSLKTGMSWALPPVDLPFSLPPDEESRRAQTRFQQNCRTGTIKMCQMFSVCSRIDLYKVKTLGDVIHRYQCLLRL